MSRGLSGRRHTQCAGSGRSRRNGADQDGRPGTNGRSPPPLAARRPAFQAENHRGVLPDQCFMFPKGRGGTLRRAGFGQPVGVGGGTFLHASKWRSGDRRRPGPQPNAHGAHPRGIGAPIAVRAGCPVRRAPPATRTAPGAGAPARSAHHVRASDRGGEGSRAAASWVVTRGRPGGVSSDGRPADDAGQGWRCRVLTLTFAALRSEGHRSAGP